MKKICIGLVFLSFLLTNLNAQTTVVLQPSAEQGKDADITSNQADINFADKESCIAYTWTNNGKLGNKRAFFAFDFSNIPAQAIITSAKLSLYFNPTDEYESFHVHSGTNDIHIERVITAWNESTITWNNQPTTSLSNRISLPPSASPTQDYLDIDVTNMAIDMHNPEIGNHGFMIRMMDESNYYKSVLFASSDHPNAALHPKLEVTWTMEGTSAINTYEKSNLDFQIFPNPNQGTFHLQFPSVNTQPHTLEVFDITGKKIFQQKEANHEIQLDEKGMFFIKISDELGNYATKKVIIK